MLLCCIFAMVPVTELLCCVHRFYCHSLLGWACCVCDVSFPYFTVYVPLWINSSKVSTTRDKVSIDQCDKIICMKHSFTASSDPATTTFIIAHRDDTFYVIMWFECLSTHGYSLFVLITWIKINP